MALDVPPSSDPVTDQDYSRDRQDRVMTDSRWIRIAETLTRAIAEADVEVLARTYAPDARIWHSTDCVELTVNELLGLTRQIAQVATATVEVTGRHRTETGFVQTHRATFVLPGGGTTSFHAALIAVLDDDGRITRLDEYLDSAGLAPLIEAMAGV